VSRRLGRPGGRTRSGRHGDQILVDFQEINDGLERRAEIAQTLAALISARLDSVSKLRTLLGGKRSVEREGTDRRVHDHEGLVHLYDSDPSPGINPS
jgi:hypothetical protein